MNIPTHICRILFALLLSASWTMSAQNEAWSIVSVAEKYDAGDFKAASSLCAGLIASDPDNDAAWYYRGLCLIAQNSLHAAEECLEKAVALDSGNFWYRYRLAQIYAATDRGDLTIEIYEKLLKDFPDKSELYFDLVEMYSAYGEHEKALATIKDIETVFGMTESVAMFRFNLLMRENRQEEAYKSLEEYNRRYSSPYVLSTLAEQQLYMYNDSTALAYYQEALELAPDYAPALLGKAETYRMTRRYPEFFSTLDEFVSNPSDHAKSKTGYLSTLIQRSDGKFLRTFMPQMDAVMEKTEQVHPADSNVLQLSGLYYYVTGRKEEARDRFAANMNAYPQSLSARAGYVEFLMAVQDWENVIGEATKAYEVFPEEVSFLEMACVGEYNLKKYDNVIELCDKVIKAAPADSAKILHAWSTKGDVYHMKGEVSKSYKAYEKALKINPDHVYSLNNYAYYLSIQGRNLKKACMMSRKTIEAEPDNATYLDTYGWILFLMGKAEEAKPHFKRAMLYGGKESAVIMDHYAEVLFALGEYDLAMVYWNKALKMNDGDIKDLQERVNLRKQQIKREK